MTDERKRLDSISLPPEGFEKAAGLAELGVLAASLLHELRQPVFAIKAHAQLGVVEAKEDARARDRLARIVEQAAHVEELLRYYGALFRAEPSDAVTIVDLDEAVRAAMEILAHRVRKSGAHVDVVRSGGRARVRGRELAARQILVNLLQNALDAVEDGAVRNVTVTVTALPDAVRVAVEDSGAGVAEDVRARAFEPFVTTKPAGKGTGLGLYIARRLAEEMGGTLVLDGASRFALTLPAAPQGR